MSKKLFLLLVSVLLAIWVSAISVFQFNLGSKIRWINDYYDRSVYAERATWIFDHGIPYVDTLSEYPQVPTYFFAVPYLALGQLQPIETVSVRLYSAVFSLFMLIVLGGTVVLLYRSLPENKNLAFLLLLPAPLYFTFNRFDILPALMVLVSILLLFRGDTLIAAIVLAIGTMTKWYPALLLPVFLLYEHEKTKRINWLAIVAFVATCTVIIAPTFVLGGWAALLMPYRMHLARGLELVSLPALLQGQLFLPLGLNVDSYFMGRFFLVLQFLPVFLSPFVQLKTKEELLSWSVIVIALFTAFSEIYSPQWILWIMPFLILVTKTKMDVLLLVVYGVSTYIAFPLIFDWAG
ncbi:MAG: DUF2029 domain-containing protein, partial [Chloroflexi bacterium]|nr:DUF2029 domain-containing protein [Chloroflexota bacterium]